MLFTLFTDLYAFTDLYVYAFYRSLRLLIPKYQVNIQHIAHLLSTTRWVGSMQIWRSSCRIVAPHRTPSAFVARALSRSAGTRVEKFNLRLYVGVCGSQERICVCEGGVAGWNSPPEPFLIMILLHTSYRFLSHFSHQNSHGFLYVSFIHTMCRIQHA